MCTFHLRDLIFFFWHFKLNLHFKNMYSISLEIFKHLYLCKHMDYSYNYCFNVFFNYFYHLASFLGLFLLINFYPHYDFYFFSSLHTFFLGARHCEFLLFGGVRCIYILLNILEFCPGIWFRFIKNIFLRFYLFLFLDRREGREREGEKHQCVVASHTPCTGEHGPELRRVPSLGIEPATLWFAGRCSIY